MMLKYLTVVFFSFLVAGSAHAELSGEKKIFLIGRDGQNIEIGTVTFEPKGKATSFSLAVDEDKFEVFFLSMRNFRCLKTGARKVCYLPYPYKTRNQITKDDLTDLEYQLLFILVNKGDPGINAWNGIYYNMQVGADGKITGQLMEADLNVLAVPPDDEYARPISEVDMIEGSGPKFHFPKVEIR